MNEITRGMLFAGAVFVGMLVLLEVGWRLRVRHHATLGAAAGEGLGAIEGAVFGLMGLLTAFTFSGAASRFDDRRALIVEEVNAIGTAYQRLDLLPPGPRARLQQQLRDYVDARLAIYRHVPDSARVAAAVARVIDLQGAIWQDAVAAVEAAPVPTLAGQLLPAINEMFDYSTRRLAATRIHPPAIIYGLLGVVSLLCALLAGYAMGGTESRPWLHSVTLAAVLAITLYVIVDLEHPRLGLFQIAEFDQLLVDLRSSMR
ncbi:MAG TPA: hypothetical protein VFM14_11620 [Gemmatimonadales bacterium]|nr:hypothetical protein [Gemmatimonadales bacterium]